MKKILLLFILIFSISNAYSEQYYADITIDIFANGEVSIDGTTNIDSLKGVENSQMYTSKNQKTWTFNLTTEETLTNFIYELNLPEGGEITYIQTTPTFRITQDNGKVKLIGIGENREMNILIQYTIDTNGKNFFFGHIYSFAILGLVIFGIFTFLIIRRKPKKTEEKITEKKEIDTENKIEEKTENETQEESEEIDLTRFNLNERQLQIVKILREHKELTQKELEKIMVIPKSSISRNIQSLSAKGIIEIKKRGITNYLSLKL